MTKVQITDGAGRGLTLDGLAFEMLRSGAPIPPRRVPQEYPTLPEDERQPGATARAEAKRERRRAKRAGEQVPR